MGKVEHQDVFITRIYTYNGISVAVNIDLEQKTVSLVERMGDGSYKDCKWLFAGRTRDYLGGWIKILDAMQMAIRCADEVLKGVEDKDIEELVKVLMAVDNEKFKIPIKKDEEGDDE